ncbi:MAG: hypothetical protein HYY00_01720 [Chloroflexi bacterium]|nr:hypothetical protein [Chloroflexota bacterium]
MNGVERYDVTVVHSDGEKMMDDAGRGGNLLSRALLWGLLGAAGGRGWRLVLFGVDGPLAEQALEFTRPNEGLYLRGSTPKFGRPDDALRGRCQDTFSTLPAR